MAGDAGHLGGESGRPMGTFVPLVGIVMAKMKEMDASMLNVISAAGAKHGCSSKLFNDRYGRNRVRGVDLGD